MIKYLEAKKILAKYIKDPNVIKHSEGVSEFAFALANKIKNNHPELGIDCDKVKIAALLHDIGKDYEDGHEQRSLDILTKEGLGGLAKICKHGFLYLKQPLVKKEIITPEEIENKIIVYSDMRFKFSPMTIEERLKEAQSGWCGTPEEIKSKINYLRPIVSKLESELFLLAGEEV